jgi:hypothetical protein
MKHPHADLLYAIADGRGIQELQQQRWVNCDPIRALTKILGESLNADEPLALRTLPLTVTLGRHELERPRIGLEQDPDSFWIELDNQYINFNTVEARTEFVAALLELVRCESL